MENTDPKNEEALLKQKLIDRISSLTSIQTEFLINFLKEPSTFTCSSKEDVLILSDLLFNIRNSLAYKNRKQKGSIAFQVYKKYIPTESQIEIGLYGHLRNIGFQLRKNGHESSTFKGEEFTFTQNELEKINSLFPENKYGEPSINVDLPNMSQLELEMWDQQASTRHLNLRSRGVTSKPKRTARTKTGLTKNSKKKSR